MSVLGLVLQGVLKPIRVARRARNLLRPLSEVSVLGLVLAHGLLPPPVGRSRSAGEISGFKLAIVETELYNSKVHVLSIPPNSDHADEVPVDSVCHFTFAVTSDG